MDVDGWRKEASINGLAVSRILGSPHSLAPAPKTSTPEAGNRSHYVIIGQFRQWHVLEKARTFPSETCVQILSQLGDVRWTNSLSSFSLPIWKMTIMTIPVMAPPSSSWSVVQIEIFHVTDLKHRRCPTGLVLFCICPCPSHLGTQTNGAAIISHIAGCNGRGKKCSGRP